MFKNIRVKKKGGGSRLQRVKVLASGKYKFVKNIGRKRGNPHPKKRRNKVTRRRRRHNPNSRNRRRNNKKIAILPTFGAIISMGTSRDNSKGNLLWHIMKLASGERAITYNNIMYLMDDTLAQYGGYSMLSKNWKFPRAIIPPLVGVVASKVASKVGLNRVLSGIPIIGKHIKF